MQATPTTTVRKVTFESVVAAAESLISTGQRPSVRAVIASMGGGSPNAVLPHLQAWKAARPSVKTADVALDPRIIAILSEQITSVVVDATRAAEARAADLEADAEAVADAGRLAEARADELAGELVNLQSENQQQAGKLEMLANEIDQVKKETATAVADARADALREREAGEQVRQTLARAELRLESLPGMEAQLAELRGQLNTERELRTAAEKYAAVAVAEQHAAERRANDLKDALEHARKEASNQHAELVTLQGEFSQSQQKAAAAREEAASLRGQIMQKATKTPVLATEKPPAKVRVSRTKSKSE